VLTLLSEDAGFGTNNIAEYRAITRGMETALSLGGTHVTVYSDSQLCVRQLTGEYGIKNDKLQTCVDIIDAVAKKFENVRYRWQPREAGLQPDADGLAAGGEEAQAVLAKYISTIPGGE